MKLSENIKKARKAKRLKLREVAALAMTNVVTLSKLETGKTQWYPKEPTLRSIANALDLNPDDLTLASGRIPDRFKSLVYARSAEVRAFLEQLEQQENDIQ